MTNSNDAATRSVVAGADATAMGTLGFWATLLLMFEFQNAID